MNPTLKYLTKDSFERNINIDRENNFKKFKNISTILFGLTNDNYQKDKCLRIGIFKGGTL